MADLPIRLDSYRARKAKKARVRHDGARAPAAKNARILCNLFEIEEFLAVSPATSWGEAVAKARYLLLILADTLDADDTRRRALIQNLLHDFQHLLARSTDNQSNADVPPKMDD